MKKRVLVAALSLGWGLVACCQSPDWLNKQLGYDRRLIISEKSEALKTYQQQPMIIDLFTSNCSTCFKMLPEVNALQQQFRHELQILLVGKEDGKIAVTYERFRRKLNLQLDVAFDSTFYNYINPPFVPRYLWIDRQGYVRGESGPDVVNSKNIAAFLQGDYSSFQNPSSTGISDDTLYQSLLIKAIPSMGYKYPELTSGATAFRVVNASINDLYRYAYFGQRSWIYGDLLYGTVYPNPVTMDSIPSQLYCYEIKTAIASGNLQELIQRDLQRYFGYSAEIVKMKMPYWSLRCTDTAAVRSKDFVTSWDGSHAEIHYRKVPVASLIQRLDYYHRQQGVFVDESGIAGPVDIDIEALFLDWNETKAGMLKAGWVLERKEREMMVLLLRSNKQVAVR